MIGITQLLQAQSRVDSQVLLEDPTEGLTTVGQVAKAKIAEMQAAETQTKKKEEKNASNDELHKVGVPSSAVGASPLTSRRASAITNKISSKKQPDISPLTPTPKHDSATPSKTEHPSIERTDNPAPNRPKSPTIPRKRRLTHSDETAELPPNSPLRKTQITGTTSAKLSYLLTKVVQHVATSKILIFYDGDNTAFYLAQALELLYINHRIYARTLDNATRSAYVAAFNSDPDIRVLLIDVACGALGLNLNAANIVLIVNPINRPGIEAQAIKRAHRIGQTKEVLVETLILEGTIEEAIFRQAKAMSRQQHVEAKELEDDAGIVEIIQHARVLPAAPGESEGFAKFAALEVPQRVVGREGREKYHHYLGRKEEKKEKTVKRARTARSGKRKDEGSKASTPGRPVAEAFTPSPPPSLPLGAAALPTTAGPPATLSIFGGPPAT
jgi:hypothetical protein